MNIPLMQQIPLGESRILEFKQELPADSSKWIKTIAAYANGAGGRLVIGVDDQRKVHIILCWIISILELR